jgi:hypothetical protein
MSTEGARQAGSTRRLAVVLARYGAAPGTPPGIDPDAFATACLVDSYEVAAELTDVGAGIAGPPAVADLLWPADGWWPGEISLPALAGQLSEDADELVLLAADVPDLPGLVVAKIFKALRHADVVVAPERRGDGSVALALKLPMAGWVPTDALDLDRNPYPRLLAAAPSRRHCALGPDWHRLRTPSAVHLLDPGLEGWEQTRALLSGSPLPGS